MKYSEKIFRPNIGGGLGVGVELPLDRDTPRGLFHAQSGNRYVVCDDLDQRFAIVLEHATTKPFTLIPLGRDEVDRGRCLGTGIIRLQKAYRDTTLRSEGFISIYDHVAKIYVSNGRGGKAWVEFSWSREQHPEGWFNGWQLDVGREIFFQLKPKRGRPR